MTYNDRSFLSCTLNLSPSNSQSSLYQLPPHLPLTLQSAPSFMIEHEWLPPYHGLFRVLLVLDLSAEVESYLIMPSVWIPSPLVFCDALVSFLFLGPLFLCLLCWFSLLYLASNGWVPEQGVPELSLGDFINSSGLII